MQIEKVTTNSDEIGALLAFIFGAITLVFCAGCITGETGSRTVVGNHYALPTISSINDEFDLKIYESTEGAVVTTRKNSLVEITYANTYTNSIFGVWDKVGAMNLAVKIEPLSEAQSEESTTKVPLSSDSCD